MHPDDVKPALQRYFARRPDIAAAHSFGSVARGTAGPRSDIDVGVLRHGAPRRDLRQFEEVEAIRADLMEAIGRDVDVVLRNGSAPDLLHRVLRDGIVVHDGDHRRRIEFEVQARNEYWDLLPILELHRRTVLKDT